MRRRLALALVALLALAGVAALALTGPAELPPAEPAPPAGELGRFLPLTAGAEPLVLDFDWLAGEVRSIVVQREIPRWDRVDGKPCARVVFRRAFTRRDEVYLTEWLRADGDAVVCSLREVAEVRHRLDPPQPVLRLPLEPGQRWSWSGTLGGLPASARFEVLSRRPDETHGELLEVQSETTLEGQTTTQITRYAAGLGPIAGRGQMPRGDLDLLVAPFEVEPFNE